MRSFPSIFTSTSPLLSKSMRESLPLLDYRRCCCEDNSLTLVFQVAQRGAHMLTGALGKIYRTTLIFWVAGSSILHLRHCSRSQCRIPYCRGFVWTRRRNSPLKAKALLPAPINSPLLHLRQNFLPVFNINDRLSTNHSFYTSTSRYPLSRHIIPLSLLHTNHRDCCSSSV